MMPYQSEWNFFLIICLCLIWVYLGIASIQPQSLDSRKCSEYLQGRQDTFWGCSQFHLSPGHHGHTRSLDLRNRVHLQIATSQSSASWEYPLYNSMSLNCTIIPSGEPKHQKISISILPALPLFLITYFYSGVILCTEAQIAQMHLHFWAIHY